MIRIVKTSVVVSLMAICTTVTAQESTEKILLPVVLNEPVSGAEGSIWTTELAITNRGTTPIEISGLITDCPFGAGCTEPYLVPPGQTVFPDPYTPTFAHPPVAFLRVDPARLSDLDFQLRVRDLSREHLTWGTDVPVIPESASLSGENGMIDIPNDPTARLRLRLYDFTPAAGHAINLKAFSVDPDARHPSDQQDVFLSEVVVPLVPPDPESNVSGYWELDLATLDIPEDVQRFRLVLEPSDHQIRYWALLSITNNETQHITIITPD